MSCHTPVSKVKVYLARGPRIGRVDDGFARPVSYSHESALQWPLRMGEFGKPPKSDQPFVGALDPFAEQPRLEARRDSGKVGPGMSGTLYESPWKSFARIVDSLRKWREKVRGFRPPMRQLLEPFGRSSRGPGDAG